MPQATDCTRPTVREEPIDLILILCNKMDAPKTFIKKFNKSSIKEGQ